MGAAHGQRRRPDLRWEQNAPAWPAFRRLVGGAWKAENIGHSLRHVFPVKFVDRTHPIAAGLRETFLANDELYHKLDLEPDVRVIARPWSIRPFRARAGKDLWHGRARLAVAVSRIRRWGTTSAPWRRPDS